MAIHAHSTPSGSPLPFGFIDLDNHPDGRLMRLCSQAGRLRDRAHFEGVEIYQCPEPEYVRMLHRLIAQISDMAPRTQEGFRLKALFLLGDEDDPRNTWAVRAPLVSVIKDALRLGLQS
ncbi:hypothetical protein [Acidisoma sp. 7E03]